MQTRLAVRQLVEFIMRSGSIDSRFTGTDRGIVGTRIHKMLQKQSGESYKSEISLSITENSGDIEYQIYGRADGIFVNENCTVIDEVKTVSVPIEAINEDYNPAHFGQGMCYAYILSCQQNLTMVGVQLTYYQIDTGEIVRFTKYYTDIQLKEFFADLLKQYSKWAQLSSNWQSQRNKSLCQMQFPFEQYREGQRKLSVAVYRTIEQNGRLFACAPTGIGKTISTIFPSLMAMSNNMADKVFYLTAKTITRTAAKQAIDKLVATNPSVKLKNITLTAKDKICFLEKRKCDPITCPYANGYFDKINEALYSIVQNESCFTRETIEEYAKQYTLCPYELSLDLSLWCDVIICDYNYLFDPQAHLQRFFDNKNGDYIFLIDEAHNLADRSRQMYSAAIDKKSFYSVKKEIGKQDKRLNSALLKMNNMFLEFKVICKEQDTNKKVYISLPAQIEKPVRNFIKVCGEYMDRHKNEEIDDKLLQIYFDSKFFIQILEQYDDTYATIISAYSDNIVIKLYCVDPSFKIDSCLSKGVASVAFSATLSPLEYYKSLYGSSENGKSTYLLSPFCQSNLGLFTMDTISTKYTERQKSADQIVQALYTMVNAKQGNYIAYFPSYSYMNQIYELFIQAYQDQNTVIQGQNATEKEKEEFLNSFVPNSKKSLLGFCVLGGMYGEGIDLDGEKLIGTAIVGVGLAQINTELDVLKSYYDQEEKDGFAYAYQYPGMNKVLQAAGRVIRTDTDKGVVLLIDSRFTTQRYLKLMPPHWNHMQIIKNTNQLGKSLKSFWNN